MKNLYPLFAVTLVTLTAGTLHAADKSATPIGRSETPAILKKSRKAVAPEDWKFKVSESDIMRQQPAGEKNMWSKSGSYYSMSIFGIGEGSSKGMPCTIVEGDDGAFYVYNPFAALDSKSWLKASIEGDRMTVDLPQAIYSDGVDGESFVYVAQLCHFEETDPEDHSGLYFTEDGETQIVFNREGDTWVMETRTMNDHPMIMGLVSADDGTWCGYSDWDTAYSPFSETAVTVPADLATEQWAMIIPIEGDYVGGRYVNVGFSGEDVYMQGFSSMYPDAWVKGTLAGGKVTFPSKQYLGADEMANAFGYFYGATEEEVYNEEWDFSYMETTLANDLAFDYDASARTMTTTGTLVVNRGADGLMMEESISAPRIKMQGEITDFTPADPVPGYFIEPGDYMGSLYFKFPTLNKQEQLLDTLKLYYRVYVDDELMTFYTDEYTGLPDDIEDVPFSFSNMENIGYYGTGDITHFFYFSFTGYESLALQTLYRDGDREYLSAIVNVVGTTSVDSVESGEAVSAEWFDLSGRRVAEPATGIYLKRMVYADGSVKTVKTIVK